MHYDSHKSYSLFLLPQPLLGLGSEPRFLCSCLLALLFFELKPLSFLLLFNAPCFCSILLLNEACFSRGLLFSSQS
jgi:hypothetical protein